jgi:hypothetical protein
MKCTSLYPSLIICLLVAACSSARYVGDKSRVVIEKYEDQKRVNVKIDGKLFTSFQWPDSVFKPVLYPVINAGGTEITRGFPLAPRPGERVDHPHHVGIWLNYGNVNGIDFWGNSYDIPEETRKKTGGHIKLERIGNISTGEGKGSLTTYASWQSPDGKELLTEKTDFVFISNGSVRIIDRNTTLTAGGESVNLPDTKEGMFAIRVARQLELPSNEELVLTDANNRPTKVPQMNNDGVTGNYRSSTGNTGEAVWGTRAAWMTLQGTIGTDNVSVVICDHPDNPGYPTYWHARGYGLFAANPLGVKDFTKEKESMNFMIPAGNSVSFRYRVIISSGKHLTDEEINILADDFAKKP